MIPDIDPDLAAFRGALRDLLRARDARQLTRDAMASDGFDASLWATTVKDLGVQGLLVPEDQDGSGHELGAAVVAVEELDGGLAPGPFGRTLLAASALAQADAPFARDALAAIAAGSQVVVFVEATGIEIDDQARLSVSGLSLPHAGAVDRIVFRYDGGGSSYLGLLNLRQPEVVLYPTPAFDVTRPVARLSCTGAAVELVEITPDAIAHVTDTALLLTAAEQVGVIRQVLDRTLSYLRDRYAFGRSVGSFQGVKHQLALLHGDLERAVALVDDAVAAMTRTPAERRLALLTAQTILGPLTVRVASEGLRLRGGIGYTWEDDSHLFFRRARTLEHAVVDPYAARQELAGLLGLR